MTLITPPNSGLSKNHDNFASAALSDALFSPHTLTSPPLHDQVATAERHSTNPSRSRKRRSSSAQTALFGQHDSSQDDKENVAIHGQSYELPAKRRRGPEGTSVRTQQPRPVSEAHASYEKAIPVLLSRRQPQHRAISPPSLTDLDLFNGFVQRMDYKKGTWFQPKFDRHWRMNQVRTVEVAAVENTADATIAAHVSPSGSRRKTSAPRVRPAAQKARSNTPKAQAYARHARNRSNMSETQHGESKQSRGPAQKDRVSKDHTDWPDFTKDIPSLDAILAMDGMAVAVQLGPPVASKPRTPEDEAVWNQLHPAEQEVASRVGLDANRFLFAKRAVFCGYLKHLLWMNTKRKLYDDELKKGLKVWNKTAAQNCASIDVNKISKLYQCWWEELGWFKEHHFQKYIDNYSDESVRFPSFDSKEGKLVQAGGYFEPE